MDLARPRGLHQGVAVGHGEADVQIIPVLRLADGADGREVPLLFIGDACLRDHLVAAEQPTDVIPLAAAIDDLPAVVEFQCAANTGGIAHLLHDLRIERQWLMVQLVRRLDAVGRKEAVEIPLFGHRLIEQGRLLALRFGQLQAARLPVAPAIGIGQFIGKTLCQPVRFIPLALAQQ